MYKISEFSKITNLTVKALRYYDEAGILKPSYRAENSYRCYTDADFEQAILIASLRNLEFSISEIKEITSNLDNTDDLGYYIAEKKEMIHARIKKEKELIKQLEAFTKPSQTEDSIMNHEIYEKQIPETLVASIRFTGQYQDIGNYIGILYKEVKNKAAGQPFCCYHDEDYREQADIELCLPISDHITGKQATVKKLPAVKGICTMHIGSYDKLNHAYKVLMDYAREHELNCYIPSREFYLKGPGMVFKGNPHKYETEIVIPFRD